MRRHYHHILSTLIVASAPWSVATSSYEKKGKIINADRASILIYRAWIIGLNGIALWNGQLEWLHLVATCVLVVAGYPMIKFLRGQRDQMPVFPLFVLLYCNYYVVSFFLPFEPYVRIVGVPRDYLIQALLLSGAAICIMVAAYYLFGNIVEARIPTLDGDWASDQKAEILAWRFWVIGYSASLLRMIVDVPAYFQAPVHMLAQLAFLGVAILYIQIVRGGVHSWRRRGLWVVMIPFMFTTTIVSGVTHDVIRLVFMLSLIYVGIKRTIPWVAALWCACFLLPLMVFKTAYRALTWVDGKATFDSVWSIVDRALLFFTTSLDTIRYLDTENFSAFVEQAAQRLDLLNMFSYVMAVLPDNMSYRMGETYAGLFWKLVPRILYPNKPTEGLGNYFGYTLGLLDSSDFTTSVNLPQLIEVYINFGPWGVVIGAFLFGVGYRVLNELLNKRDGGGWNMASAVVIFSSLLNIESNLTLVYGHLVFLILFFYIIGRLVVGVKRNGGIRKNTSDLTRV